MSTKLMSTKKSNDHDNFESNPMNDYKRTGMIAKQAIPVYYKYERD